MKLKIISTSAFILVFRPALPGLEAWVGFVDHIVSFLVLDVLAVAMTVLGFFEGGQDFHRVAPLHECNNIS